MGSSIQFAHRMQIENANFHVALLVLLDLYIHSPIYLHGPVFNSLSTGTTLNLCFLQDVAVIATDFST
jgi:hypothetical protein